MKFTKELKLQKTTLTEKAVKKVSRKLQTSTEQAGVVRTGGEATNNRNL